MKSHDFFINETECASHSLVLAGADEAGRGPLAGPVAAAAVIMPTHDFIDGIDDSKKLSEKKRELLFERIISEAVSWKVAFTDVDVIESINILNATRRAFESAVLGLSPKPDILLCDYITGLDVGDIQMKAIIKGDAAVYSIAAASIIAKVSRDRLMRRYDEEYPEYGFAKHKGYGTKQHIEAIKKYGPCPIHRLSFLKGILEK